MFCPSWNGSGLSFFGEGVGTSVILTGSELPSNQLASFATDAFDLCLCILAPSTSNSAASLALTRSGEAFLLRIEGRNVESRVGEGDEVCANKGGSSTVVLDRWCPRPDVGGGSAIVGWSLSLKGVGGSGWSESMLPEEVGCRVSGRAAAGASCFRR